MRKDKFFRERCGPSGNDCDGVSAATLFTKANFPFQTREQPAHIQSHLAARWLHGQFSNALTVYPFAAAFTAFTHVQTRFNS